MRDEHKETLYRLFIDLILPTVLAGYFFIHYILNLGEPSPISMDDLLIGTLRFMFVIFLLPILVITDWLVYFGIIDASLGTEAWQFRLFSRTIYVICFGLIMLKLFF